MLAGLYGAWAAQLGDRELSTRLFEEGFAAYVSPWFNNVLEYRQDRNPDQPVAGPFTANLSGFLVSCLYGLPGVELSPDPATWCRRRVVMPSAWDAIAVERIWVQGRPMTLTARHGDGAATLEPL